MTPKKMTINRVVMNVVGVLVIAYGIFIGASMSEETGNSIGDALGRGFAPWVIAGSCVVGIFILLVNNWAHLKSAYKRLFGPEDTATNSTDNSSQLNTSANERTPPQAQKQGFFGNRRNGLLLIAVPSALAIIGFATSLLTQSAYNAGLFESGSVIVGLFQLFYNFGQIIGIIGIITFIPCLIAGIVVILTGSRPASTNKPHEPR